MKKHDYIFREITKEEIPQMFWLILQRMKWMDEKGIKQWNVTNFDKVYPESCDEDWKVRRRYYVFEVCGRVCG